MKYDELIQFFFKECPEVVKQMNNSNHHYDEEKGILNPYHLEGSVLTHTLMVVQQAEMRQMPEIIKYACLFHDFGKPECREENHEKQRVSFYNHDSYSAFKSLYYMKKLELSTEDKIRLFKMISLHTDLYRCDEKAFKTYAEKYQRSEELLKDLVNLSTCDGFGRFTVEEVSPREEGIKTLNSYVERITEVNKTREKPSTDFKSEAIVLIGLPMSGKSTWIKNFMKENPNYTVVSRDEIILELGNGKTYNEAYKSVDSKEVDELFRTRVNAYVKEGKNLIFDLTHLSRKSRRRTFSLLNKTYKKTAKVILADLEQLKERNLSRKESEGKFINEEVIDGMIKSFYPPLYDEFEEIDWILSE